MKYGSLKSEKARILSIPVGSKGLELSKPTEDLTAGQLAEAKNVWYNNGRLTSRTGLYSTADNVIETQVKGSKGRHNFELTDTTVFYNGESMRIATEKFYYDLSTFFICVYLIASNGSVTNAGYMNFNRLDDDTFYTPENITFYVGAPQNGGGIFALVSLINEMDYVGREYRIYEINADMNGWSIASGYYIPTVYINGRGNAYEQASNAINATPVGTPTELEAPNLLDGRFYAYYTSDGYSYSFRLPLTNLSDSTVVCRIHQSLDNYTEWVIYGGQTAATVTFYSVSVTANVDRQKGIIYFTVPTGNFAVPKMDMYCENNIRITAVKKIADGLENVISSSCSAVIGSRVVFSGGRAKNRLYYTKYDNPLYFPYNPDDSVGFSDSEVTGLVSAENRIVAFKRDSLYTVTLKKGAAINDTALLADNDGIFYKNDTLEVKCAERNVGCDDKLTAVNVQDFIVWLAGDRNVYSLTASGKVYNLSNAVRPYLEELTIDRREFVVGACTGKYYILSLETKALIIKYDFSGLNGNTECISTYVWDFPEGYRIIGPVENIGKLCFLCENKNDNVFFTAVLKGENDALISGGVQTNYPIESSIKTGRITVGTAGEKVKIGSVYLQLTAKGKTEIKVLGNKNLFSEYSLQSADFSAENENSVRLISELSGAKWIELSVKNEDGLAIGKADVYYTRLIGG